VVAETVVVVVKVVVVTVVVVVGGKVKDVAGTVAVVVGATVGKIAISASAQQRTNPPSGMSCRMQPRLPMFLPEPPSHSCVKYASSPHRVHGVELQTRRLS
jgi:hypothetical protein